MSLEKETPLLRRVKDFENYILRARDGDIGKAKGFLFDDHKWTVRYLVADTGSWLSSRLVLISPLGLSPAIGDDDVIPIGLTMKQIEESPSIETDEPVSRQFELEYHKFYDWPFYGGGPHLGGGGALVWTAGQALAADVEGTEETLRRETPSDPFLRSTQVVTGYEVRASDGTVGHVNDFIIDERDWTIKYLIVETNNWWHGQQVLVSPQWIDRVSLNDGEVFVNLSKDAIKGCPQYTPETLNRDYEAELPTNDETHGNGEGQSEDMSSVIGTHPGFN